jgi:hypothetical protein
MSAASVQYATVDDEQAKADDLRGELISKITQAIMGDNTAGVGPMVNLPPNHDVAKCNEAVTKVAASLAKQLEGEGDLSLQELQTKIIEVSKVSIVAQLNNAIAIKEGSANKLLGNKEENRFSIALRATVAQRPADQNVYDEAPASEPMKTPQGEGLRAQVNSSLAASAKKTGDSGPSSAQGAPPRPPR